LNAIANPCTIISMQPEDALQIRQASVGNGNPATQLPILLNKITGSDIKSDIVGRAVIPRRILVVDDNADGVASLSMLLTMVGHETSTAFDGLEAVSAAERFDPHIVLLDLDLPKLDGYEVCRRIRRAKWGKSMMLVAVTGLGQEEYRQRSLEAGFDMHLVKPVSAETLMVVLAAGSLPDA
jgi:CheY-like chemotaxis protein